MRGTLSATRYTRMIRRPRNIYAQNNPALASPGCDSSNTPYWEILFKFSIWCHRQRSSKTPGCELPNFCGMKDLMKTFAGGMSYQVCGAITYLRHGQPLDKISLWGPWTLNGSIEQWHLRWYAGRECWRVVQSRLQDSPPFCDHGHVRVSETAQRWKREHMRIRCSRRILRLSDVLILTRKSNRRLRAERTRRWVHTEYTSQVDCASTEFRG